MKSLASTHMPVRKYTRRECKPKLKPWITQGIISSVKHRDYFFAFTKDQTYLQISKLTNNSETALLMSRICKAQILRRAIFPKQQKLRKDLEVN